MERNYVSFIVGMLNTMNEIDPIEGAVIHSTREIEIFGITHFSLIEDMLCIENYNGVEVRVNFTTSELFFNNDNRVLEVTCNN